MSLANKTIAFALTGSHCTFADLWPPLSQLKAAGADLIPLVSESVYTMDTRFGTAEAITDTLVSICGNTLIHQIVEAEPLGPKQPADCLVIAPCTGNTLAKLAQGITDTAVLMAAKATLRNEHPIILAIATNDGLGLNARNIGTLLASRNVFFVPFGQDQPEAKPRSLMADLSQLSMTIEAALAGRQLQPILTNRVQSPAVSSSDRSV